MPEIEHNPQGKVIERNIAKELVTCEHGITGDCWWCNFNKEKQRSLGMTERIESIEDHLIGTMAVLKMLVKGMIEMKGKTGAGFQSTTAGPVSTKFIDSGNDADKPSGSHQLAFWFSDDTDTIYQWRDDSWIDISYSRPGAGERRITNLVEKDGAVEVTHED